MPGYFLTTASQVACTHGGTATLTTSNTKVKVEGRPVLLQSDVHSVRGCGFTVGTKSQPCVKIQWTAGTAKSKCGGKKMLIVSSIGKCISAEGVMQGFAIIAGTQTKVRAV